MLGDNSGNPVSSLNLGSLVDASTYTTISDSAFERQYSCDNEYLAQMLIDHYRVTDSADGFVTSPDAVAVIDSTGAGACGQEGTKLLRINNTRYN